MNKVTVAVLVIVITLFGVACSALTDAKPTPSKVIVIEESGFQKAVGAIKDLTGQSCAA